MQHVCPYVTVIQPSAVLTLFADFSFVVSILCCPIIIIISIIIVIIIIIIIIIILFYLCYFIFFLFNCNLAGSDY